jgi:hypothetical protein
MRMTSKPLLFAVAVVVLAAGCKKSELTQYEQADMIYIYKDAFNTKNDSATYSFAIKDNILQVDTVKVPVRIMGVAKNTAREVKLGIIATGTTAIEGTHYEFLPYTIPAGAYSADLPVVIKRTTALKTQEFRLQLQILESKDFKPGVPHSQVSGNFAGASLQYLIKINDFLTKPSNWDSRLATFFGSYSQVKYKFVIEVTGLFEFSYGFQGATIAYGEMLYYQALCKRKLEEYVAVNGPLMDEFGAPVVFP